MANCLTLKPSRKLPDGDWVCMMPRINIRGCKIALRELDFVLWEVPKFENDTSHFIFVYCDLIHPRRVGDSLVPLLRSFPIQFRKRQHHVLFPLFFPVNRNETSDYIKIGLRDEYGRDISPYSDEFDITIELRHAM